MPGCGGWQASPRGEDPPVAVREAEEARAGGGARIINTAARRPGRDGIRGPGIAALMAEAGLAGRHRTAAGLPSGRSDGHNRLCSYYHCRRAPADGKWFLRRAEERLARAGPED